MYIAIALLTGRRTCILTATKALQDQLASDFGDLLCVVKGKNAYPCRLTHGETNCDSGLCNFGLPCAYKNHGCGYFEQLRKARSSRIVVTNYHFWCANNRLSATDAQDKLGQFDMLVCDEAHNAPAITGDMFTVEFRTRRSVDKELMTGYPWGGGVDDTVRWLDGAVNYAIKRTQSLRMAMKAGGSGHGANQLWKWQDAVKRCAEARAMLQEHAAGRDNVLVVDEQTVGQVRIAPVWPFERGGRLLFMDVPKVLMTSATVRPKTMGLLGLGDDDYELVEYPHTFPVANRRLVWLPTIRLNYETTPLEKRTWHMRIDQVLRTRQHLNGVIHSVSYDRAQEVVRGSQYGASGYLLGHERGEVERALALFKAKTMPRGLVSPSVGTGVDFPGDQCRYQVIVKIPYPNTGDALTRARCAEDTELGDYTAMTELVQMTGRGVRAADDWAQNYIIDDNINWFMKHNKHFAPRWFWADGAFTTFRRDYVPDGKSNN
jgi:Rad3-related DNA helicase